MSENDQNSGNLPEGKQTQTTTYKKPKADQNARKFRKFQERYNKCADCGRLFITFRDNGSYCPYCKSQILLVNMPEDVEQEELEKFYQGEHH